MAPKPKPHLGLIHTLLFFVSILSSPWLSLSDPEPTVYEILPQFGLPAGLLPDSVTNYTYSSSDGRFIVVLAKPCYIQFDYMVFYDTTITGKLSYGSITGLKGIQVGLINKKLDVGQFKTIHSCRDKVSGNCAGSLKRFLQLPTPLNEYQMLLT
ncbi:hypothetical protein CMV_030176, partial [Castanea mollissima]